MAHLATLLSLLAIIALANGCAVSPGGCSLDVCTKIEKIRPSIKAKPLFGFYFGVLNKNAKKGPDGPVINYESFKVRAL